MTYKNLLEQKRRFLLALWTFYFLYDKIGNVITIVYMKMEII